MGTDKEVWIFLGIREGMGGEQAFLCNLCYDRISFVMAGKSAWDDGCGNEAPQGI